MTESTTHRTAFVDDLEAGEWEAFVEEDLFCLQDSGSRFYVPTRTLITILPGQPLRQSIYLELGGSISVVTNPPDALEKEVACNVVDDTGRHVEVQFATTEDEGVTYGISRHGGVIGGSVNTMTPPLRSGRYELHAVVPSGAIRKVSFVVTAGTAQQLTIDTEN